jgi:hypothetical protein
LWVGREKPHRRKARNITRNPAGGEGMASVLGKTISVDANRKPSLLAFFRSASSKEECRGFVNRSAIGVGVWRFVEGVNTAERSRTVVARVYPASDPATVARPYVLL